MSVVPLALQDVNGQVYTHEAPDGTLRAWNATLGNALAAMGHPVYIFSLEERGVTVERIAQLYEGIDEEYALTTDLTRPLLFIPMEEKIFLIDGWHRLWHAAKVGVPELPMYLLTHEEADAILLVEMPPGSGLHWK